MKLVRKQKINGSAHLRLTDHSSIVTTTSNVKMLATLFITVCVALSFAASPKFPYADEFKYTRIEAGYHNITFHYNYPWQNFRMDWTTGGAGAKTSTTLFTEGVQYSIYDGLCYISGTKWNATLYDQLDWYRKHYYYTRKVNSKQGIPCFVFEHMYEKVLVSEANYIMIESWLYKDALYETFSNVSIGRGSASDPNLYKLPIDKSKCKVPPAPIQDLLSMLPRK